MYPHYYFKHNCVPPGGVTVCSGSGQTRKKAGKRGENTIKMLKDGGERCHVSCKTK